MQKMFLTVSNFPVRRTGSKKALYFIINDTPKLSPPKYFDNSKNKIYSATFFFRAKLRRYIQRKFEMSIITIIIIIKQKQKSYLIEHKYVSEYVRRMGNMKMKEKKSNHHKSIYY